MTREGLKCKPWNMKKRYKALGGINNCRHPDPTKKNLGADGPWCYADSKQTIWDYCHVRHCHDCDVGEQQLAGIRGC